MAATNIQTANGTTRIFIVDDHALVRCGLAELISHETDMAVCGEAEDGGEAMRQMERLTPDLVVVDISLKSSNGIDLIKRIKARHPDVKILVSSMHDESLFAERALQAGASGYVNKEESTDTVVEAIRKVMQGHVYLSPQMTDQLLHRVTGDSESCEVLSVHRLSNRELEVFELIGNGLGTRQIADRLRRSVKTIETHREHIKEKQNLTNSAELAHHAVQWVLEVS